MFIHLQINCNESMSININQITFIKPLNEGAVQGIILTTISNARIALEGKYASNFIAALEECGKILYIKEDFAAQVALKALKEQSLENQE